MRWMALWLMFAAPAAADVVVPLHNIRPKTVLNAEDLAQREGAATGAVETIANAVGLEASVMLYAGRPIRASDLAAPAVVERNQIVKLRYRAGSLEITTDARALGRAAVGDVIQVQNATSHATLFARVLPDGTLTVD